MGRLLREALADEVGKLRTEKIRRFVEKILDECSDANATKPASSSGKYHPDIDNGEGGLIRHTKIVCRLTEIMVRCLPQCDRDITHDQMLAAAMLHDLDKYDDSSERTRVEHPILMSLRIIRASDGDRELLTIAALVESHMSRWNILPDGNPVVDELKKRGLDGMPTPVTIRQYVICFADMISADMNFMNKFVWD